MSSGYLYYYIFLLVICLPTPPLLSTVSYQCFPLQLPYPPNALPFTTSPYQCVSTYLYQKDSMSSQHVPECIYPHIHLQCFMHRPNSTLKARVDLSLPMKLYQLLFFPFPSAAFVWSTWFGLWLCTPFVSYMPVLFPQKLCGPSGQGPKLVLFPSVMASLTLDPGKGHCRIFGVQQGMKPSLSMSFGVAVIIPQKSHAQAAFRVQAAGLCVRHLMF